VVVNDKRAAIVAAALGLIRESGLASFTQPRVAQRLGLRQNHVTYYFPTRSDLLLAVAEEAVRQRVALGGLVVAEGRQAKVAALAAVLAAPEQTRMLIALTQSADQEPGVRGSMGEPAASVESIPVSLLLACWAEVTEASLGLLQALSTGLAVLTLGRGDEFLPTAEPLLNHLLDRLSPYRRRREATS
jgi:AcrR family transcriptional regulator